MGSRVFVLFDRGVPDDSRRVCPTGMFLGVILSYTLKLFSFYADSNPDRSTYMDHRDVNSLERLWQENRGKTLYVSRFDEKDSS